VTFRPIHLLGSPVLRQPSIVVDEVSDETPRLIDDLFETMYAAKGIGLAANQVGETVRVAVVDTGEDQALAMVNPKVLGHEGRDRAEEGCLSIPDLYGEVDRAVVAEIEALDRDGKPYRLRAEGLLARVIQHEIDHLDGVLFIDHLSMMKRRLLLAKWRKQRKGKKGFLLEVEPQPAGDR
jgi:peptide deformylase